MEFIHRRNAQRIPTSLVTDEIKELAGGEQVEVIVTIDEQEYDKAREELISDEAQDGFFLRLNINAGLIPNKGISNPIFKTGKALEE